MGHKVHPYGFRLGFNKPWRSRWFAKQGYPKLLREDLELKETLTDGMKGGYQEEMQAYTRVPLSRFAQRVFYNKTLLKKLTGLEKPPTELRAFLKLCEQIHAKKLPNGQPYTPITSSNLCASGTSSTSRHSSARRRNSRAAA